MTGRERSKEMSVIIERQQQIFNNCIKMKSHLQEELRDAQWDKRSEAEINSITDELEKYSQMADDEERRYEEVMIKERFLNKLGRSF